MGAGGWAGSHSWRAACVNHKCEMGGGEQGGWTGSRACGTRPCQTTRCGFQLCYNVLVAALRFLRSPKHTDDADTPHAAWRYVAHIHNTHRVLSDRTHVHRIHGLCLDVSLCPLPHTRVHVQVGTSISVPTAKGLDGGEPEDEEEEAAAEHVQVCGCAWGPGGSPIAKDLLATQNRGAGRSGGGVRLGGRGRWDGPCGGLLRAAGAVVGCGGTAALMAAIKEAGKPRGFVLRRGCRGRRNPGVQSRPCLGPASAAFATTRFDGSPL